MITSPTVLILGAGSNVEYGFPTGDQLRMEIIEGLWSDTGAMHQGFANSFHYDSSFISEFGRAFYESSASIDRFLETNPNYKQLGYDAITHVLTRYERLATSHEKIREGLYKSPTLGWYDYLWSKLDEGDDKSANNKLSIITLNYDRSLEQYLAMAWRHIHKADDATIGEFLERLKFTHLYGTIGGQPFIDALHSSSRPLPIPFGDTEHPTESAATLKIVERTDDVAVSDAFGTAHDLIAEAEFIFMLGFGFDWLNCERLAIGEHIRDGKRVFGTAYNMGEGSKGEALKLLGLGGGKCTLHSGTCLELFDKIQPLPTR